MDVSKRNVVVVGQNNAGRRALQLALNLEGYGVHAADNASEGWELIDKHWPEAVVLDIADDSPDVLGLVRDLRRNPHHRHVVIVAAAPVPLAAQERAGLRGRLRRVHGLARAEPRAGGVARLVHPGGPRGVSARDGGEALELTRLA